MVKISVIVPVHNGEKFIHEFMDCLMNQTMQDFEVIFVDDASTDNTRNMLMKSVLQNERYHYLCNDTRQGAAHSRNCGLEKSKAPYVLCLDVDDRFESDLLEQVSDAAYGNDADMVMLERGDFRGFDLQTIERSRYKFQDEKKLFEKKIFSVNDQPIDFFLRCENGTCDRVIRKELLDKYQIRFQNLPNSNDVFYTVFSTFAAERIVHTQTFDNLYHRRIHTEPGRISNQRDPMCAYEALLKVHDKLIQENLWRKFCIYFWVFALDSIEKQLFVCKNTDRQKQVYNFLQKEGLYKLGVESDIRYIDLPSEFRKQYLKFLDLSYEEKCFNYSMTMEALSTLYSYKIFETAKLLKEKRIGFWGVGRATSVFIEAFKEQGGSIKYIIDNDEEKQGNVIKGIKVLSFEEVYDNVDTIIISNRHYYHSIKKQILNRRTGIKILSLEEIVYQ